MWEQRHQHILQNESLNLTPVRLPETYLTWNYSERYIRHRESISHR